MSTNPEFLHDVDEASQGIEPSGRPVISLGSRESVFRYTAADERKKHADQTRRWLAAGILGVVLILDVFLTCAFVLKWGGFTKDDFGQAMTNLAGPNALAAAVIGFYYGNEKTSDRDESNR